MINWRHFHAWKKKRKSICDYARALKGKYDKIIYIQYMADYQRGLERTLKVIEKRDPSIKLFDI